MRDERLIGAVASKGVGDDLRDQIRIGRARPICPVGEVLRELAVLFADMLVANNPCNCAVVTSSRGLTGRAEISPFRVLAAVPAFSASAAVGK